jgi:methyl halide transferase
MDFFDLQGSFDLIVEQTFFCALDPSLRTRYVQKCRELLAPEGKLAGLLFDREFKGGPPFGGSALEYRELFSRELEIKTLDRCHNSVGPRAGHEIFIIARQKKP